jgi:hypothetical protein
MTMLQVLEHNGGNDFKVPHLQKQSLRKVGMLLLPQEVQTRLVHKASSWLDIIHGPFAAVEPLPLWLHCQWT